MSAKVAALYVERGGPYFGMPDVDPWDKVRDARLYAGPLPIIAHPPCGPWGKLRHLYRGDEHDCAPEAIAAVRKWGGVVEHPAHSLLWGALNLPEPGGFPATPVAFSIEVDQCAWGHVARKRSWLYFFGISREVVLRGVRIGGTPTHWISGGRTQSSRIGSPVLPGIKVCSAQQRRRTPPLFARWLADLATSAIVHKESP